MFIKILKITITILLVTTHSFIFRYKVKLKLEISLYNDKTRIMILIIILTINKISLRAEMYGFEIEKTIKKLKERNTATQRNAKLRN